MPLSPTTDLLIILQYFGYGIQLKTSILKLTKLACCKNHKVTYTFIALYEKTLYVISTESIQSL